MNTGGKSRNDLVAGSWVQPCRGCNQPRCKGRVFVVTGPLTPDILNLPELQKLFEARAELYATGNSTGITPLFPSPTPTPAPPSPMPTPTPTPIPPQEAEHSATPATPALRTLHFDYGGYGGLHYSPDGHIVASSSNSTTLINDSDSDDDIPDLQSPGGITWDLCTPVALCLRCHEACYKGPRPLKTMVYPCPDDGESRSMCNGHVVLQDFKMNQRLVEKKSNEVMYQGC
ncbi:hypothetical protein B0H10DRAFT_1963444 [Mycena sp. CBHHK59/15]|nr:hypothetical protein B0H10DRAFT_1963444 [Mycena sp. CBHHK59/15]